MYIAGCENRKMTPAIAAWLHEKPGRAIKLINCGAGLAIDHSERAPCGRVARHSAIIAIESLNSPAVMEWAHCEAVGGLNRFLKAEDV